MRILLPVFLAVAGACHGSMLSVSLIPDSLIGNAGDVIQFAGTLSNTTGSTVFLNSDSFTFAITGALNDTPFFLNSPFSMIAFESSGTFDLLEIVIPLGQAPGTYDGVFTVLGGTTDSAVDPIGSAAFHLTVNAATADTPEPGSLLLMSAGVAGLMWRRRRARA